MTKKHGPTVNEGIQANTVTADVIAVGRAAQAHKTVQGEGDRRQLLEAIDALHQELKKLKIDSLSRDELRQHASEIEQVVTAKTSNPKEVEGVLGGFVQKLKEVGIIVKDVAGMVSPLQTIAGLFHVSLACLGLPM